jgi:hypothetical protein
MKTQLRGQSDVVAGLDHFLLRDMKRAFESSDFISATVLSN